MEIYWDDDGLTFYTYPKNTRIKIMVNDKPKIEHNIT